MREIRFRGKRVDNGGWVYGFLVRRPSAVQIGSTSPWAIIVPPSDPDDSGGEYWVVAESIGQYTGLKDKNGKEIYEGDIVKSVALTNDHNQRGATVISPIEYWNGNTCLSLTYVPYYPFCLSHDIEVIGNIYENPELMA